jgi:hypothetical protein
VRVRGTVKQDRFGIHGKRIGGLSCATACRLREIRALGTHRGDPWDILVPANADASLRPRAAVLKLLADHHHEGAT